MSVLSVSRITCYLTILAMISSPAESSGLHRKRLLAVHLPLAIGVMTRRLVRVWFAVLVEGVATFRAETASFGRFGLTIPQTYPASTS